MRAEIEQEITVRKVRTVTIFKLLLFGLAISLVPLGVAFGIAGYFGADTVKWNSQPVHGISALFAGPAISLFLALMFTGFLGSLSCLGLWLLSLVRPINIKFVPEPNKSP
jgi:hypothetical protein